LGVTAKRAAVLGDGASGNLVDPGPEALFLAQAGKAPLHAHKDILQNVVDIGLCHPSGNERAQPR
jgi:hypothetical protein